MRQRRRPHPSQLLARLRGQRQHRRVVQLAGQRHPTLRLEPIRPVPLFIEIALVLDLELRANHGVHRQRVPYASGGEDGLERYVLTSSELDGAHGVRQRG